MSPVATTEVEDAAPLWEVEEVYEIFYFLSRLLSGEEGGVDGHVRFIEKGRPLLIFAYHTPFLSSSRFLPCKSVAIALPSHPGAACSRGTPDYHTARGVF